MLRKLFQSKKSIEEKKIFEKDEIAKMLRVNPEQLKKFKKENDICCLKAKLYDFITKEEEA